MKMVQKYIVTLLLFIFSSAAYSSELVAVENGKNVIVEDLVKTYLRGGKSWVLIVKYVTEIPLSEIEEIQNQTNYLLKNYSDYLKQINANAVGFKAFNKEKTSFGVGYRKAYTTVFELKNDKWVMYKP